MSRRKNCRCRKGGGFPIGAILIALGLGIFIANIIPYYLLIAMLGIALIIFGICYIIKRY